MLMDAQARPSNAQALSGTGTIVSTDQIDLLTASDNPGRSGNLRAVAVMNTALAGATSIQAQLVESANSNMSSPTVLASGPVVALAAAGAGAKLMDVSLPDSNARYLGFQYVIVGTASGGSVTAGLVGGTDRNATVIPMNLG